MSLKKKTIKLVKRILNDPKKRELYSDAEIMFMERQIVLLEAERARRVQERKERRGFLPEAKE